MCFQSWEFTWSEPPPYRQWMYKLMFDAYWWCSPCHVSICQQHNRFINQPKCSLQQSHRGHNWQLPMVEWTATHTPSCTHSLKSNTNEISTWPRHLIKLEKGTASAKKERKNFIKSRKNEHHHQQSRQKHLFTYHCPQPQHRPPPSLTMCTHIHTHEQSLFLKQTQPLSLPHTRTQICLTHSLSLFLSRSLSQTCSMYAHTHSHKHTSHCHKSRCQSLAYTHKSFDHTKRFAGSQKQQHLSGKFQCLLIPQDKLDFKNSNMYLGNAHAC